VNGAALNLQRGAISRSGEKATQGLLVLISGPNVSIQGPRKITPLKVDESVTMTTLHDQTGVSVHRNAPAAPMTMRLRPRRDRRPEYEHNWRYTDLNFIHKTLKLQQ
jgi:hypothetical protein